MRKKIPVSAPQQPLQSPFSALDNAGLPAGPADPPTSTLRTRSRIVLRREKAQRGGKTVIVVSHLPTHLSPSEILALVREARRALGCGGSVRGREIELQGDQVERVRCHFQALGYEVAGP
jgi:translation initiation factor 1